MSKQIEQARFVVEGTVWSDFDEGYIPDVHVKDGVETLQSVLSGLEGRCVRVTVEVLGEDREFTAKQQPQETRLARLLREAEITAEEEADLRKEGIITDEKFAINLDGYTATYTMAFTHVPNSTELGVWLNWLREWRAKRVE